MTLEGRLDSNTAPQLEVEFKGSLVDITELVLNFAELVYLSSGTLCHSCRAEADEQAG